MPNRTRRPKIRPEDLQVVGLQRRKDEPPRWERGFQTVEVQPRPGVTRRVLHPVPEEAEIVREIFRLYVALGGAKAVARELNQRGLKYRTGGAWTKDLVLSVVGQTATIGTYFWGKRRANRPRPWEEWLPLVVGPIVDREVFEVVQRLRKSRDPASSPGRGVAKPHLLTGLLRCTKCGVSYQLETSGKKVDSGVYRYCYYKCRNALRAGVEVCSAVDLTGKLDSGRS